MTATDVTVNRGTTPEGVWAGNWDRNNVAVLSRRIACHVQHPLTCPVFRVRVEPGLLVCVTGHPSRTGGGGVRGGGEAYLHPWSGQRWEGVHKAMVLVCLPLAAPIGLSPLHLLTPCGPKRVLVVSTEGGGGYYFLSHSVDCQARPQIPDRCRSG